MLGKPCLLMGLTIAATTNFMNLWYPESCEGPPDVSIQWAKSLPKPEANWPNIYNSIFNVYSGNEDIDDYILHIDACGETVMPSVLPSACCITRLGGTAKSEDWYVNLSQDTFLVPGRRNNSLTPKAKKTFWSTSFSSAQFQFLKNVPSVANGYNYCILKKTSLGAYNLSELFGFNTIAIKEGSNAIGITCGPGGLLDLVSSAYNSSSYDYSVYGSESFIIPSSSPSLLNSKHCGVVSASFGPMDGAGASPILWRQYYPLGAIPYPNFRNGWEIVEVIFVAFCFLAICYTLVFFAMLYNKKRNPTHLQHTIVMTIWLSWLISSCFLYFNQTNDSETQIVNATFNSALLAFTTFYSVMHTTYMLIGVAGQTAKLNYIAAACVVLFHLGTMGPYYLFYWGYTTGPENYYIWTVWSFGSLYWDIFCLFIIAAPVMFLIYTIVIKSTSNNRDNEDEHGGPWKRLERLLSLDKKFSAMVFTYLISICIWALLRISKTYYALIYGDVRIVQAWNFIRYLFFLIPFVVNCFFLDHLPNVVANKMKYVKKSVMEASVNLLLGPSMPSDKGEKKKKGDWFSANRTHQQSSKSKVVVEEQDQGGTIMISAGRPSIDTRSKNSNAGPTTSSGAVKSTFSARGVSKGPMASRLANESMNNSTGGTKQGATTSSYNDSSSKIQMSSLGNKPDSPIKKPGN